MGGGNVPALWSVLVMQQTVKTVMSELEKEEFNGINTAYFTGTSTYCAYLDTFSEIYPYYSYDYIKADVETILPNSLQNIS